MGIQIKCYISIQAYIFPNSGSICVRRQVIAKPSLAILPTLSVAHVYLVQQVPAVMIWVTTTKLEGSQNKELFENAPPLHG